MSDAQLQFSDLISESVHPYTGINKKQSAEIREAASVHITSNMIFLLPEVLDIIQTLIPFLCSLTGIIVKSKHSHKDFRFKKKFNGKNKEKISHDCEMDIENLVFLIQFSECLDF